MTTFNPAEQPEGTLVSLRTSKRQLIKVGPDCWHAIPASDDGTGEHDTETAFDDAFVRRSWQSSNARTFAGTSDIHLAQILRLAVDRLLSASTDGARQHWIVIARAARTEVAGRKKAAA